MSQKRQQNELMHPNETRSEFIFGTYSDYERKGSVTASFPSIKDLGDLEWPDTGPQTTNLRFIYWSHLVENGESLIAATQGSDLVALESVMLSDGTESDAEDDEGVKHDIYMLVVNLLSNARLEAHEEDLINQTYPNISVAREAVSSCDSEELFPKDDFYSPVLRSLVGSAVRLEFLDLLPMHTKQHLQNEATMDQAVHNSVVAINEGKSFNEIAGHVLEIHRAQGITTGFRENISINQINQIIEKNRGANISIVYGSMHLMLSRMILAHEVTMQRVFVEDNSNNGFVHKRHHSMQSAVEAVFRSQEDAGVPASYAVPLVVSTMITCLFSKEITEAFQNATSKQKTDAEFEIASLWENEIPQDGSRRAKKALAKRIKQTRKIVKSVKA